MEFINKFYVKVDKDDLLGHSQDENFNTDTILELLDIVNNYEKKNNVYVKFFYLSVLSDYYRGLLDIFNIPIKRKTLVNAYIQSLILGDEDKTEMLASSIMDEELYFKFNCDLFNYVLDHSMGVGEFWNGEKQRLVLNHKTKKFENKFIYNSFEKSSQKKKKINFKTNL